MPADTTPPPAPVEVDLQKLAVYVQSTATDAELIDCAAEAGAMVADLAKDAVRVVPPVLLARAGKETAAELFYRRGARGGVMSFGDGGGDGLITQHVRNDALSPARVLLAPYLPPAMA